MPDLLPPLVLLVGLLVCADARADDLDDARCDASPLHMALCEAVAAEEACHVERVGAIATARTFELERDNARESLAAEQQARIAAEVEAERERQRKRTWRNAAAAGTVGGVIVGVVLGVGVAL